MDQMKHMQLFLAKRIVLTLAYTEQFGFPLQVRELYTRLLVGFRVDIQDFCTALIVLSGKNLIQYLDGYFFIAGLSESEMHNLISLRRQRQEFSKRKWQEVQEFVGFAKKVPCITGVAVTGSLAVNNSIADDDIDFMIVTAANRLWLARLLVILYASLKGKRRSFAKEEKNSWCFNLWIEESELQLPEQSRSIYTAYEVVQAIWVFSRGGVFLKFGILNDWIRKIVFGARTISLVTDRVPNILSYLCTLPIISWALLLLNHLAYCGQYWYMKPHMTREKVGRTHAFFHPRDTRSKIFENWKQTLGRLGK